MDDFDELNAARGCLFQAAHNAVNDAAFSLTERSNLNELLAHPLAADHFLMSQAAISAKSKTDIDAATAKLEAACSQMQGVLAGANSRDERRVAIDDADAACDLLGQLMR